MSQTQPPRSINRSDKRQRYSLRSSAWQRNMVLYNPMTPNLIEYIALLGFVIGFYAFHMYRGRMLAQKDPAKALQQSVVWLGPLGTMLFKKKILQSPEKMGRYIVVMDIFYCALFMALLFWLYQPLG